MKVDEVMVPVDGMVPGEVYDMESIKSALNKIINVLSNALGEEFVR